MQSNKNAYPEVFSGGHLVGWKCFTCGEYNDLLRPVCRSCNKQFRPANLETKAVIEQERRTGLSKMDKDLAEKHAAFFNAERILIKDMDWETLKNHRKELEDIAREARARLTAIDTEERERTAHLKTSDKEWLLSHNTPDVNVSDAISAVKTRKDRMSKADKLLAAMKDLGIDGAESLVRAAEKKATESQMNSISFNKPKAEAKQVNEDGNADNSASSKPEDTKPFDPSGLFS